MTLKTRCYNIMLQCCHDGQIHSKYRSLLTLKLITSVRRRAFTWICLLITDIPLCHQMTDN